MYKRILVPVDGSATSQLGLKEAVKLVKESGGKLLVVHVVDEFAPFAYGGQDFYAGDMIGIMRDSGKRIIKDAVAAAQKAGVEAESALVESIGVAAADKIVKQAAKWRADLIVLGTHGRRGLRRVVLGSDAEQVVRSTTVPVLLIRAGAKSIRSATARK